MKQLIYCITLTFVFSITGCAQTISDEAATKYANQISDNCKLLAAQATELGYGFIPSYTHCIDDALLYLETKRKARETPSRSKTSFVDIAEYFAKDAAKERLGDIAKSQFKKL